MANTLSQYIGQIIDRRNQELQQRLAPLIPLLQADLAETKRKAEIERQKQLRISDYGAMIGSNFDEETSAEFLQGVGAIQTTEGEDAYYTQFTNRKQLGKEIDNRVAVLRQMGLPDELLTEAVGAETPLSGFSYLAWLITSSSSSSVMLAISSWVGAVLRL